MATRPNVNGIMDPELTDALQQLKTDIFRNMNCVKIGTIRSFDGSKKTAQVAIAFKRVLNGGTIANYPVLVDCPVFTLQGGGGAIQFPIAAGDQCLLLFCARNIDAWFTNGDAAAPFDARCHDLSDGIALVGLNALSSDLESYGANVAKIFYAGASIALEGGVVTIANQTTTLLTLLNGLITVIEGLLVQDGSSQLPFTAASIAQLEAFKLQLAELLG